MIRLNNVSKKYLLNDEKDFFALKDISLNIRKGSCHGIIGPNGAGKTTLLKLMAGIIRPSRGQVKTRGRILSFLQIGTGFKENLTGRDNIYLYGSILGIKRRDIRRKFDEIVSLSGIEEFIDVKLKYYSAGMKVRLAFAVSMSQRPDILLLDEIISVGDEVFQKKSFNKLNTLKKLGKTIVLVSHNLGVVREFCDHIIYMRDGRIVRHGEPLSVIYRYLNDVTDNDYYNMDILRSKMAQLKSVKEELSMLKDKRKSTVMMKLMDSKIRRDMEQIRRDEIDLTEEINENIIVTENLLERDLKISEDRLNIQGDKNLHDSIINMIDNLVEIKEIKLSMCDEESKVTVLNRILELLYKKRNYAASKKKGSIEKSIVENLIRNLNVNRNPYERSENITKILNSYNQMPEDDSVKSQVRDCIDIERGMSDEERIRMAVLKAHMFPEEMSKVINKLDALFADDQRLIEKTLKLMAAEMINLQLQIEIMIILDRYKEGLPYDIQKLYDELLEQTIGKTENTLLECSNVMGNPHSVKKDAEEKIRLYSDLRKKLADIHPAVFRSNDAKIKEVWFSDKDGKKKTFRTGSDMTINIKYDSSVKIKKPVFGIAIYTEEGFNVTGPNTASEDFNIGHIEGEGAVRYKIEKLPLLEGTYYVSVSIHDKNKDDYDHRRKSYWFEVISDEDKSGAVVLENRWEHSDAI